MVRRALTMNGPIRKLNFVAKWDDEMAIDIRAHLIGVAMKLNQDAVGFPRVQAVILLLLLLSVAVPTLAAERISYIHTDALGSPVAITDTRGVVIERKLYEPYGVLNGGAHGGPSYAGHVQDDSTSVIYMQQRYYDPQIGAFLSVDPISAYSDPVRAFGRYRYANGNPYGFTDPDGRQACGKDTTCRLEQGETGGVAFNRGSGAKQSEGTGYRGQTAYGRPVQPSDPAWTRDERVLRQMETAWQESNPFAPPVKRGLPGSIKHEQGGWVIQPYGSGAPELHRAAPGTRDRMGFDVVRKPSEFECGCTVLGFFHSHPNTREEGYAPGANSGDYRFLYYMGVPGMIRSHSGYEFVPIPEGGK